MDGAEPFGPRAQSPFLARRAAWAFHPREKLSKSQLTAATGQQQRGQCACQGGLLRRRQCQQCQQLGTQQHRDDHPDTLPCRAPRSCRRRPSPHPRAGAAARCTLEHCSCHAIATAGAGRAPGVQGLHLTYILHVHVPGMLLACFQKHRRTSPPIIRTGMQYGAGTHESVTPPFGSNARAGDVVHSGRACVHSQRRLTSHFYCI